MRLAELASLRGEPLKTRGFLGPGKQLQLHQTFFFSFSFFGQCDHGRQRYARQLASPLGDLVGDAIMVTSNGLC